MTRRQQTDLDHIADLIEGAREALAEAVDALDDTGLDALSAKVERLRTAAAALKREIRAVPAGPGDDQP